MCISGYYIDIRVRINVIPRYLLIYYLILWFSPMCDYILHYADNIINVV